jgi:L-lactate dehydrogenase complex protein LldG
MATVQGAAVAEKAADPAATFSARLQPLNVRVERVANSDDAAMFLAHVGIEVGAPGLVVSAELTSGAPGLMAALSGAKITWLNPADVAASRDAPLGVSLAMLAVAETGSVMLAEESLTDRAVGMLTKTHVVVVRTETLVPSLEDAAEAIKALALRPGGGYASLVTGPSRTADIELSLSLGVQGPERVFVLLVDTLD